MAALEDLASHDLVPNVALVVVHGVGRQGPGDPARGVGDLLLNLDADGETAAYTPFREERLHVRTRRLEPRAARKEPKSPVEERSPLLIARYEAETPHAQPAKVEPPEILFMQGQLLDFEGDGPDDQFDTIRLRGRRLPRGGHGAREVHLYDMYWSDLVTSDGGVFAFFGQLFQILFHLPSLGRHAVDYGRLTRPGPIWTAYSEVQAMAERLLTIGVPVLNLLLLVASTMFAPTLLSRFAPHEWLGVDVRTWFGSGIGAAALLAGAAYLTFQTTRVRYLALGAVAAAVASVVLALLPPLFVLCSEWIVLGLAAFLFVVRTYAKYRPWAFASGSVLAGGLFAFLVFELFASAHRFDDVDIAVESMRSAEIVVAALAACWVAYLALQLAALGLGALARMREPLAKRSAVARIAATARLSLSLPTVLFVLLTVPVAWTFYSTLASELPEKLTTYAPMLWRVARGSIDRQVFVERLIDVSATDGFLFVLVFAAIALVLAVGSLFPSVAAEIVRPQLITGQSSQRYGRWLTRALVVLTLCAELITIASAFGIPLGIFSLSLHHWPHTVELVLRTTSVVLTGSALGLLGLRGRLESLALGFRSPLDAVLDIDTYLREHPRDATPRAQICARYVSLLRYLRAWRDPETGRGYDGIVIAAHSQGGVITADLLRFMRHFDDELVADGSPPITLLTTGSPLRQFYAARLPDLYSWLGRAPHELGRISDGAKPAPDELGVARWINAYRSGDYIGRALWTGVDEAHVWACATAPARTMTWRVDQPLHSACESKDGKRRELCIGPGAHSHYWDSDGAVIARELDAALLAVKLFSAPRS